MDKETSVKIFVVLAWIVSIYHLILGLIGIFGPGSLILSVVQSFFGITASGSVEFFVLAKFIAAYMILMGIMMAFVAKNPYKFGKLAWATVIFFVIRVFNRLAFFSLLNQSFGTTMARNMVTVIPISLIAIGLAVFMPKSKD